MVDLAIAVQRRNADIMIRHLQHVREMKADRSLHRSSARRPRLPGPHSQDPHGPTNWTDIDCPDSETGLPPCPSEMSGQIGVGAPSSPPTPVYPTVTGMMDAATGDDDPNASPMHLDAVPIDASTLLTAGSSDVDDAVLIDAGTPLTACTNSSDDAPRDHDCKGTDCAVRDVGNGVCVTDGPAGSDDAAATTDVVMPATPTGSRGDDGGLGTSNNNNNNDDLMEDEDDQRVIGGDSRGGRERHSGRERQSGGMQNDDGGDD